ncbi:hypothetical protein BH10ACT2_BH10ACT2_18940 [soil metagenome]
MNNAFVPTLQRLDSVAWTIDQRGINAIPAAALRELGFLALSAGASHVLTDVLVDTNAPSVARQRAYGRIASVLADPAPKPRVTCAA